MEFSFLFIDFVEDRKICTVGCCCCFKMDAALKHRNHVDCLSPNPTKKKSGDGYFFSRLINMFNQFKAIDIRMANVINYFSQKKNHKKCSQQMRKSSFGMNSFFPYRTIIPYTIHKLYTQLSYTYETCRHAMDRSKN